MSPWPTLATEPTVEAIRLLGVYTAGRFDIWMLAGQQKASCRSHVMSVLTGIKTPQSKAGITALREAFYLAGGIEGDCLAAKEDNFLAWVREITSLRRGTDEWFEARHAADDAREVQS